MTSSVIGALRVNLGLNSAQFDTGMKRTQSTLATVGKQFAAFGAAAGVALAGISAGLMRAAGRADEMGKAAQGLGVGVDELSKLRHAADLSGVSFSNLQTGVRNLNAAMANLTDANSPAVRALNRLGIETRSTDGRLRSTSAVLEDVADRFAKMEDGAQKSALASALFGNRIGASLIPMLNQGRDGLQAMGEQAEKLGLVIDQKTATASERFNDNLTLLGKSMDGVFNKVLAQVAPAFETLSFRLMDAVHSGGALDTVTKGITFAMNALARGVSIVFDNLSHLTDLFKIWVAAKTVSFTIALAGAFVQLAKTVRVAGLTMAAFTSITRLKITTIALAAAALAKLTGQYENLVGWLQQTGAALMNALPEGLRSGIDNLTAGFRGLGKEIEGMEGMVTRHMADYLNAADEAADSFGNVGSRARTAAEQVSTSWDGVAETMSGIEDRVIDLRSAMQTLASGLANAFTSALDGSRKFSDSLRGILQQLANMALNRAFQALLGGIFGGGGGGFLSSIFGGFRKDGGPVSANRAYVVGERGPELIVPRSSGTVIPNHALGGGGRSIVEIRMNRDVEGRILQQAAGQSVRIVSAASGTIAEQGAAVAEGNLRSGRMDGTMSRFGVSPQARRR